MVLVVTLTVMSFTIALKAEDTAGSEEAIDQVRALYDKGVELFQQQKYAEAARTFNELVAISPQFHFYYNIGSSEYLRKRYDLAMEAFQTYLKNAGEKADPERRAKAAEIIAEISATNGYVELDENTHLEVWIDGEHRSNTPVAAPIALLPGEHLVVLKKRDKVVHKIKINVSSGKTVAMKQLETQQMRVPDNSHPQRQEKAMGTKLERTKNQQRTATSKASIRKFSTLKISGIITAGVGVSFLVASGVTGKLAMSKSDQLAENCNHQKLCEKSNENIKTTGKKLENTTDGLLIAGAATTVAGIVLAIVGHKKKRIDDRLAKVKGGFFASRNVFGLQIQGRFQ